MVLGTCNMGMMYNKTHLTREASFKIIEEYEKLKGDTLDTALNYGNAHGLIKDYGWKGKVITKVWNKQEIDQCFETLNTSHIHCIMARNVNDHEVIDTLHKYRSDGLIDKVGASIYYINEVTQMVNAFELPFSSKWEQELTEMLLHADVYIRSFWNSGVKNYGLDESLEMMKRLKSYSRDDLNHCVKNIVGVENINHLKESMEWFW